MTCAKILHMKLDLTALEVLECVVDSGSVAAAAQRLNKTPSAISYQLKRLEEQLDISLINRTNYRLALTDAGELVLTQARRLLRQSQDLIATCAAFRAGWEPNLRIVFDGALPQSAILAALSSIEKLGSPTRVELHVRFLNDVHRTFETMDADIMISAELGKQQLTTFSMPPMMLVLCCGNGHPLAMAGKVSVEELVEHTELVVQGAGDGGSVLRPFFGSRHVYYLSDFQSKATAMRHGLGYGWLPEYLIHDDLDKGDFCEVRCDVGSRYYLYPVIATQPGRPSGKAATAIVTFLMANGWNV